MGPILKGKNKEAKFQMIQIWELSDNDFKAADILIEVK